MNLQEISHIISNPSQCSGEDSVSLKELTIKYPYAQIFSILYLKSLSNSKNIHFEEELKNHAFRISNRTKLYDLIQDSSKEIYKNIELNSTEEQKESALEVVETKSQEEICIAEFPTNEDKDEASTIAEINFKDDVNLETEIVSSLVSEVYSESLKEEKENHFLDKKELNRSNSRSFTSWLKLGNTTIDNNASESKINHEKIIEKFIQEEPKISKPVKEFYSPSKKAKESLNEENVIYSETLAEIFAIQGNFPKAIIAFQKLILTNPEKSVYFATRIEELKKKINN
jgi:hypothetical protein